MACAKGDEARNEVPAPVVTLACVCCTTFACKIWSLVVRLLHIIGSVRWYESTVRTSPQTEVLSSFWCFMPFACGFNCCRQQTVIPLKLPCVHVCVSLFFGGAGGWKMPDCVFMCVYVCMRDVRRNALWYRNAISSLSVYGCIGFIRIWKCWAAVPGVSGCLCPLPLLRSPSHSFTGLGGLPGWLMH